MPHSSPINTADEFVRLVAALTTYNREEGGEAVDAINDLIHEARKLVRQMDGER
jgi:hypothetical protein